MTKPGGSGLSTTLLLAALLLGVVLVVSWTLGLFVGGNAFLILGLVLVAFVGLQFVIFRALGLRSPADDEATHGEGGGESGDADEASDGDWRAWRG